MKLTFRQWPAPFKIGLGAAALGLLLAVIGIARGQVPLNPISVLLALLISGGMWGLVAWAIATAAVDVEADVAEKDDEHDDDPFPV